MPFRASAGLGEAGLGEARACNASRVCQGFKALPGSLDSLLPEGGQKEKALRRPLNAFALALFVFASGLVALVAAAVALAFAGEAGSTAAAGATEGCGATIKVPEQATFKINRYAQDSMRFVPGTVTIKSGCSLTFEFATPGQTDPHTLSIVNQSQLPKTTAQIENCKLCQQIGSKHVKNPTQPPGPTNPVLHWIVNVGKPGLDAAGDSIAILEAPGAPPGHKSVTVPVSAAAGTTLYFMCAVHPWMQGKIIVR